MLSTLVTGGSTITGVYNAVVLCVLCAYDVHQRLQIVTENGRGKNFMLLCAYTLSLGSSGVGQSGSTRGGVHIRTRMPTFWFWRTPRVRPWKANHAFLHNLFFKYRKCIGIARGFVACFGGVAAGQNTVFFFVFFAGQKWLQSRELQTSWNSVV